MLSLFRPAVLRYGMMREDLNSALFVSSRYPLLLTLAQFLGVFCRLPPFTHLSLRMWNLWAKNGQVFRNIIILIVPIRVTGKCICQVGFGDECSGNGPQGDRLWVMESKLRSLFTPFPLQLSHNPCGLYKKLLLLLAAQGACGCCV